MADVLNAATPHPARTAWVVFACITVANFGDFCVYDSFGPFADPPPGVALSPRGSCRNVTGKGGCHLFPLG